MRMRYCDCCGNTKWMGYPIHLELHHKDGNRNHNELSNFEYLCLNCYVFIDPYCRKDKGVENIDQLPKPD